jgi:peptidyl-prolyl cis-trans isomerase D
VIKLSEIKPPHTPTLDEMRPQLEAQARADTAAAKVYQMAQKYTDAHGGGANMAGSATAAGVSVQSVGPVSAGGVDMTRRPAPGLTPKLLADAFKLPAGAETDMENEGPGEYFAVRVDKILPPAVPSLAELKPMLAQFYMSTEMEKALKAKADELTARIRKGESIDAVAASAGAKVGHATGVSRFSLARNQSIGEQMAAQIFNAKKGDVFDGATGQRSPSGLTAFMVARIDALSPPVSAQAAAMTAQRASALSEGMFEDLVVLLRDEAKSKIKPKIDADLARQALGLSPDSLPKAPDVKPAGTRAQ